MLRCMVELEFRMRCSHVAGALPLLTTEVALNAEDDYYPCYDLACSLLGLRPFAFDAASCHSFSLVVSKPPWRVLGWEYEESTQGLCKNKVEHLKFSALDPLWNYLKSFPVDGFSQDLEVLRQSGP